MAKQTKIGTKIKFKGRSYIKYNKADFQGELQDLDWAEYFALQDPNAIWDFLKSAILKVLDPLCPLKTFCVPEAREPWVTNEVLEIIRDKDKLMRRARRTGSEEHWVRARRARNEVGRQVENVRADYLKTQQETHKNDPKEFWKSIAPIFPGKKKTTNQIWLKDQDTGRDLDQGEIPDYMNTFFTEIGPNLAKKHSTEWRYYGDTSVIDIPDFRTDFEEVILLCRDIECLKSSGMDEISSRICKDAFLALPEQLTFLFNSSLETGIFPEAWKRAKVVPIYKGGNRGDVSNYRPVSLLPLPGKLLEKIVHDRFSSFLDETSFLTDHQGGFRKGFSTTSTIADLTDEFFTSINRGDTTLAAFVDLKKAFDTVNTNILIKKLKEAGIRNRALSWCESYLNGRSQRTMANGESSGKKGISCGVPQGSVLGPLFF